MATEFFHHPVPGLFTDKRAAFWKTLFLSCSCRWVQLLPSLSVSRRGDLSCGQKGFRCMPGPLMKKCNSERSCFLVRPAPGFAQLQPLFPGAFSFPSSVPTAPGLVPLQALFPGSVFFSSVPTALGGLPLHPVLPASFFSPSAPPAPGFAPQLLEHPTLATPAPDKRVARENVVKSFLSLSLSIIHLLIRWMDYMKGTGPALRERFECPWAARILRPCGRVSRSKIRRAGHDATILPFRQEG